MQGTKIRWATDSWNPFTGCTEISPGCDHCYARVIAEKFRGTAFPQGFTPMVRERRREEPLRWKDPRRVFVNSMSDLFHDAFTDEQIDQVFRVMAQTQRHQYLVLTKRPRRMERYCADWLARQGLGEIPAHIWLGVTIELDRYSWRATVLRRIPVPIRFISAEPLLGSLSSLDLAGIAWLIVGGESGPHMRVAEGNPRWMNMSWARELRDKAASAGTAYFYKQDSGTRTELRPWLEEADGSHTTIEQYPEQPSRQGGHRRGSEGRAACGPISQAAFEALATF